MIRPFTACLCLSLAALAFGAAAAAEDLKPTEGKIARLGDNLVVVQSGEKTTDFVVAVETKISLNGKPAMFKDLKPGQRVKVTAEDRDGRLVAVAIEARRRARDP